MARVGVDNGGAERAIASLSLYIGIYLFMNLTAFAIVAFLRNRYRTEQISDYAGLVRQSPGIVICFAIVLFSLVGLPPLAGFIGKFAVFASVWQAYQATGYGYLAFLLVVGGINTAISLFYYLRVVKVMAIDAPDEQRAPAEPFPLWSISGIYAAAITAPLILLFVAWEPLHRWTLAAAHHLFS
jgi:NADH-quinone oxidoreductase subunit N